MTPTINTDHLSPDIARLMSAAAARQWCVMLADGRNFYLSEDKARRFQANNTGSTLYPPAITEESRC